MKIRIEDTLYDFDQNRLMRSEAQAIKLYTGFTLPEWQAALEKFDIDAVAGLVWLLKSRAGEDVPRFSELDFNLADFEVIPDEGDVEDPTAGVTTPTESG